MFIAEIGINHHGSVEQARKLVLAAKAAGSSAVKFQYRSDDFYNDSNQIGDEILVAELERTRLDFSELNQIFDFAKSKELAVGVSFFRVSDFDDFQLHDQIDFYKIPSAEHKNTVLIDLLLSTGKRVFISTGGADLETLPGLLGSLRLSKLDVMHCIANYPVALGQESLHFLSILKSQGWRSVGYSSHDECYLTCLVALGLGIDSLERHIVLDKNDGGLDSSSSSIPSEFKTIGIFTSQYLGSKIGNAVAEESVHRNQGEILNMQNLGTGLYARKNLVMNNVLTLDDFEVKAPRLGLSVGDFLGRSKKNILRKNIKSGHPLCEDDFCNDRVNILSAEDVRYFHDLQIGLPVRLHDYSNIKQRFPLNTFEFHLSYGEVLNNDLNMMSEKIDANKYYSIHLPDYVSPKHLIDLFADNAEVLQLSNKIIRKVVDFSKFIQQITGKMVPIVGSFPFSECSPAQFVNNLGTKFDELDANNVYPQWLPVHGWYFGGHSEIETFNSYDYVQAIINSDFKICLDISHLIMSANYHSSDWEDWYKKLLPHTAHLHISDAKGIDGEGLAFGSGDLSDKRIIVPQNCLSIIEVWQGHLNNFAGFESAIEYLSIERILRH
ncbi:N-acetylneuraminate synthase family protein [Litorivicinus sp.]|nr:N-acetylneuraminate synthase family protein [Litorivicinus sp.]